MLTARRNEIAYALLRVTFGMIFLTTGLVKIVGGLGNFDQTLETQIGATLPPLLVTPFAYILPFVETTIGALLLIGLFNVPSLLACGLLLFALTFGVTAANQVGTTAGNLSYILINFVLLWFSDYNRYSVDSLIRGRQMESRLAAS